MSPIYCFSVAPYRAYRKVRTDLLLMTVQVAVREIYTSERKQDTARVRIKLLDVNDNSPRFPQNVYRYTIKDNLETNTPLHEVRTFVSRASFK